MLISRAGNNIIKFTADSTFSVKMVFRTYTMILYNLIQIQHIHRIGDPSGHFLYGRAVPTCPPCFHNNIRCN